MNRENYVEPIVADSKGNLYVSMKYHKENIEDLQQRTDKAIDYIEKHSNKTSEYLDVWEVKKLLEILKGSNND